MKEWRGYGWREWWVDGADGGSTTRRTGWVRIGEISVIRETLHSHQCEFYIRLYSHKLQVCKHCQWVTAAFTIWSWRALQSCFNSARFCFAFTKALLHSFIQYNTHTRPFNGPFIGATQVSQYLKGKTNLDFTEVRDSEWQWHQLGHMQVCISLQTDNHASTPPLSFFTGLMPFLPPTQQCQSTEGSFIQYKFNNNLSWF